MTPTDTPLSVDDHAHVRRRSVFGMAIACAATALALSSCGVGGEPVEAGVQPAATDVETTECPGWANDILAPAPAGIDADADGLREHFLDRSAAISEIAEQLPADDAAVISAYAVAVSDFGNDPVSSGASRRMGEAAADAAAVANRSC